MATQGTEPGALLPGRNLSAHLESIDTMPLFMKDLPDEAGGADDSSNFTALDALQSLTFDGTPDEVALSFKKQGNDYFAGKRYVEARGFYTQALNAFPSDTGLKETLLINRAACNLALENHGQVLRDCSEALALNSKSVKAFYRSAKALDVLQRYVEAIDCCDHALQIDSSNKEAISLRQTIVTRQQKAQRRQAEITEYSRRKKDMKVALDKAFLSRGLWAETSARPPDNPNPPHFDLEALKGTSADPSISVSDSTRTWSAPDPVRTAVVFPVAFLYPQYAQSDFVSHFHEDTTIGEQLEVMFPSEHGSQVEWDRLGEYTGAKLRVFATTHEQRLLRIGRKLTLREAIDHCARDPNGTKSVKRDGMVLRDGILSLIILPEGNAEQDWIERFKRERAGNSTS